MDARSAIPIRFKTHHPQGLVKIGDRLFLSSVEVSGSRLPAKASDISSNSISADNLIADLTLGEGAIYHPGGIDYDGRHIWVAVAEYRPDSRSIVYRVDPQTMTRDRSVSIRDHLGAHRARHRRQHVAWRQLGLARLLSLAAGTRRAVTNAARPELDANSSHYIDYQDCKYRGPARMVCTGVTEIRRHAGVRAVSTRRHRAGEPADHRPIHQVPVLLWAGGLAMTQNPVWLEATANGLRGYFIPEDDASTLYVYEAK